jgi:hypothetical protein
LIWNILSCKCWFIAKYHSTSTKWNVWLKTFEFVNNAFGENKGIEDNRNRRINIMKTNWISKMKLGKCFGNCQNELQDPSLSCIVA